MLLFTLLSLALVLSWYKHNSWQFVLILIHSISIIYSIFTTPPPNIFSTFKIPLNTPTDAIRALLHHTSNTSPELEDVLARLTSFESRSNYVRFGHNVLATCTYCRSAIDFATYAFPRVVLSYIAEIAFIGLTTFHRRRIGTVILVIMAFTEGYLLATVTIHVGDDRPVVMWHDILFTIRRALFIILPILIHFIPTPTFRIPFVHNPTDHTGSSLETAALLVNTQRSLSHLLPSLHLLKYAQAATMRVPSLRRRAGRWWEEEARVGSLIRDDDHGAGSVRDVARALDLSFDDASGGREEGKTLLNARMAVRGLLNEGTKTGHSMNTPIFTSLHSPS